jgi:hypothetical protein
MGVRIVAEHDAPGGGPAGLAWDGQQMWLADYREGAIFRLNPRAEVVGRLWCPGNLSGLTWDGRWLWQAVFDEGLVRSLDPVTTDFDQTHDLRAYGWLSGLAWDGTGLRVVAQQTGDILTVEPASGAVRKRLVGPVAIGDIDYREGVLWISVALSMAYIVGEGFHWLEDDPSYALVQMDAATGREITRHTMPGLYTGLAWADDGHLWLASAAEGKLYRAAVTPD